MKKKRGPGMQAAWPERMLAVFGTVMLVLSLMPTQGLAEARNELIELLGVPGGGTSAIMDWSGNAEGEILDDQSDDLAAIGLSGDESVTVGAQGQDDHDFNFSMAAEWYKEKEQIVKWTVSFELTAVRLSGAKIVATMPGADLDKDGTVETYDEFLELYGACMVGSSDDTYVTAKENGLEITFPNGIMLDNENKPVVQILFYSRVNSDWYDQGSKKEVHTCTATLYAQGKELDADASMTITKDVVDCEHENMHCEYTDPTYHTWCCDNEDCGYRKREEHTIKKLGGKYTCECGAYVSTVTFDLGEANGTMETAAKVKGFDYVLPSIPEYVVPPAGKVFYGWLVKVGDGQEQKLTPGEIVHLTDDTTAMAIWNGDISYLDQNQEPQSVSSYEMLTANDLNLDKEWYVVSDHLTKSGGFNVTGKNVNIILCDGANLEIAGILVKAGMSLNVYGQSEGTGTITCTSVKAIANFGSTGFYGGKITGASGEGIYNEGILTIGGGTISDNDQYGVRHMDVPNASVTVKGKPVISGNGAQDSQKKYGLYLCGSTNLNVAGSLNGAKISVLVDGQTPRRCTTGYSNANSGTNPQTIFTSASGWMVVDSKLDNDEVTFYSAVPYIDENGKEQILEKYTAFSDALNFGGNRYLGSGWYVVRETQSVDLVVVSGDVKLILCEGTKLSAKGVNVNEGNKLTIYGQVSGFNATGSLVSNAGKEQAGIGGSDSKKGGKIIICGGHIEATGGEYAAGIGGGDEGSGGAEGITIYDGNITASGGSEGAGIGSGDERTMSGSILIYGGYIRATGGWLGSGIGGGDDGAASTIFISGKADIEATGGKNAAGIGGGEGEAGGDVTIVGNSCKVVAHGQNGAQGIGRGNDKDESSGSLNIDQAPLMEVHTGDDPVEAAKRRDTLRWENCCIQPCRHKGKTYNKTISTHTPTCKYCLLSSQKESEEAHDFGYTNVCKVCGAKRVTVEFKPGDGGVGSMDYATPTATFAYQLPTCEYTAPEGKKFYKWEWGPDKVQLREGDRVVIPDNVDRIVATALWTEFVPYIDKNGEPNNIGEYTLVEANSGPLTLKSGWYVVKNNIDFSAITVEGKVHLVLCDGVELADNSSDSIKIEKGAELNLYGQTLSSGTLNLRGKNSGIENHGSLNIYGGVLAGSMVGIDDASVIGSGIGIVNRGTLNIVHGKIEGFSGGVTNDTIAGDEEEASAPAKLSLDGRFEFKYNSSDIILQDGVINVLGELSPEHPIRVDFGISSRTGVFTNGLKAHNPNLVDPTTIFEKRNDPLDGLTNVYPELTKDGEAEIDSFVYYIDENDEPQARKSIEFYNGNETSIEPGWYFVRGNVTCNGSMCINGEVNFILADDSKLEITDGLYVAEKNDADLHIWWQSGKSGKLVANTKRNEQAAIGGYDDRPVGNITIHGGIIEATGSADAAAIGGGSKASGGVISILNGNVTATGGTNSAAIGGGNGFDGGAITITGGTVTATGRADGNSAAIGGGNGGAGGTIAISGGTVKATGGVNAAAIGGGNGGAGGTIDVSSGTIDATAGIGSDSGESPQAFGHGAMSDDPGTLSIAKTIKVKNNDIEVTLTMGDVREEYSRKQQATLMPCEHAQSYATPTEDQSAHIVHCSYCAVDTEGEKPHEFDLETSKCICGVYDMVTVSFDKGEGKTDKTHKMDPMEAVRNQEYSLPTACDFIAPSGRSFDRWSIDGEEYLKGETIKPANDITVVALWNSPVSYVDENNEDASVGVYETLVRGIEKLDSGWYVLKEDLALDKLEVSAMAKVNLILCDNATLTINDATGIKTGYGSEFKVYGQRELNNGTIASGAGDLVAENVVKNTGTTILYGGVLEGANNTVQNIGTLIVSNGSIQNGTRSCVDNMGYLTVSGGKIETGKQADAILNEDRGVVTIEGGDVYGAVALNNRDMGTKATITGGNLNGVLEIVPGAAAPSINTGYAIINNGSVDIEGGTVSGEATHGIVNKSKLSISGGTVKDTVSQDGGTLHLSGGTFTDRNYGVSYNGGTIELSGNPVYSSQNTRGELIWFAGSDNSPLVISDEIASDASIGIGGAIDGVFTSGFATKNPSTTNPAKIFTYSGNDAYTKVCPELTEDGEAEITRFVEYVTEDGTPMVCRDFELLSDRINSYKGGSDAARHLKGGWFVIDGILSMTGAAFDVYGETNLILVDDCKLEAAGIYVAKANDAELHIWGQEAGTGNLASKPESGNKDNLAGIGGSDSRECGTIVIHGGTIDATGGTKAAGIGGGTSTSGGTVKILGGAVHAKGGENAEAIGKGEEASVANDPTLYDAAKVTDANRQTVLRADRIATCHQREVTIAPCAHEGAYTQTANGHTIDCKYCLTTIEEEQPHEYNAKGVCACGKQDSVTLAFKPGAGKGTMEQLTVVRNQPVNLPECTFTAPKEGQGFYKWQVGDEQIAGDRPFTPTQDNTVLTALWNDFVPYIDEQGEPAEVGIYTNLADDFDRELDSGWYVVKEDLTLKTLKPNGQVALVLCDGATLTIEHEDGFNVEGGNTVNIYGQANQTGTLVSGSVSGDATVIKAEGEVNLYGGIIDGQKKVVDTIEVTGELNIAGGSIANGQTSNVENKGKVDFSRGAVYGSHYGLMGTQYTESTTISGTPVFTKDGVGNSVDVYLRIGDVITVDGELNQDTSIVVALQSSGMGIFTKGLAENSPSITDPSTVFNTPNNVNNSYYGVVDQLVEGEGEIATYVHYVDENGEPLICRDFDLLSKRFNRYNEGIDPDGRYLKKGWFVLDENLAITDAAIDIWDAVNIILVDGKTLDAKGIFVDSNHAGSLEIWGQKNGQGVINTTPTNANLAGIGGADSRATGPITIHGGIINAKGGSNAAGIGCGSNTSVASVTILGGTVTAEGQGGSAAIGHGRYNDGEPEPVLGDTLKVTNRYNNIATNEERTYTCATRDYVKVDLCKHVDGTEYVATEEAHSLGCKYCNLVNQNVEKHSFGEDNICTVCGYERIIPVPELKEQSLVLSGQIGLTALYYLPEIEDVEFKDSYVEFAISGKNARTVKVPYDKTNVSKDGVLHGYTCYVSSIEMAQPITATLHYGVKNQTVVNEGLSVENYVKNFDSYCNENPGKFTSTMVELVHAIADYGHYVQPLCSTTNKWNIGADYAEMATYYTVAYDMDEIRARLNGYVMTANIENAKITAVTSCLYLDSNTGLDVFIAPEDGVEVTANGMFSDYDVEVSKRKDGRTRIRVKGIPAHQLSDDMRIAGNADGEYTVDGSALSYANAVVRNSAFGEDGDNAMAALYKYYELVMAVRSERDV